MQIILYITLTALLASCSKPMTKSTPENLLVQLMSSRPEQFETILSDPAKYKVQILYTRIDRNQENYPRFTSHGYRLNEDGYYYPASTVKLPAAILALEKLNNLNIPGLNKYSPLQIDSAFSGQRAVTEDSTAPGGFPSIAHYIKKILLVSDNDAYNCLFEFLGQQYIRETLLKKGYEDAMIIRRLSVAATPEQNAATNPFTFFDGDGNVIFRQPLVRNLQPYSVDMPNIRQGAGYYRSGELVEEPIDFSNSNYMSIASQQAILRAVIFPEAVSSSAGFLLDVDDYNFLYRYMSLLPRESGIAAYSDTTVYYDSYGKYFLFGNSRAPIPENIRIFNKIGQAYGYLIDNAYVVDFERNIEFLLTAVIQVNENRIYNDDTYEYDEIGLPFMANLGRLIYDHELTRKRDFRPELTKFKVKNEQ